VLITCGREEAARFERDDPGNQRQRVEDERVLVREAEPDGEGPDLVRRKAQGGSGEGRLGAIRRTRLEAGGVRLEERTTRVDARGRARCDARNRRREARRAQGTTARGRGKAHLGSFRFPMGICGAGLGRCRAGLAETRTCAMRTERRWWKRTVR